MTHVKYKRIQDIGLQSYLDETSELHGGNGYEKFVEYFDQLKVNQINIAKIFHVHRGTMKKWIDIHRQEQSNG